MATIDDGGVPQFDLLDHFAGLAMQVYVTTATSKARTPGEIEEILLGAPASAYAMAEAMISEKRELEKGGNDDGDD